MGPNFFIAKITAVSEFLQACFISIDLSISLHCTGDFLKQCSCNTTNCYQLDPKALELTTPQP